MIERQKTVVDGRIFALAVVRRGELVVRQVTLDETKGRQVHLCVCISLQSLFIRSLINTQSRKSRDNEIDL